VQKVRQLEDSSIETKESKSRKKSNQGLAQAAS
jgi:hypothetical protein